MEKQKELQAYIQTQLSSGLTPGEITQQLRGAGWDEQSISSAFNAVQGTITPTPQEPPKAGTSYDALQPKQAPAQAAGQPKQESTSNHQTGQAPAQSQSAEKTQAKQPRSPQPAYRPIGQERGRIKTGWLLLRQSFKVLYHHKQLVRYPVMSSIFTLIIAVTFIVIFMLGGDLFVYEYIDSFGEEQLDFTAFGYFLSFIAYVVIGFIVFVYNAGLAAHALDIFRGRSRTYKEYMKLAWAKKPVLFIYSVINATVGVILSIIENKFKWIGVLVSRFLGAVWSLANLFTIPIIVETDSSAPKAIKQSAKMFVERWGENVTARLSFAGIFFVIYLVIVFPFFLVTGILLASILGGIGFWIFLFLIVAAILLFSVVEMALSQILSISLYYYARYQQVPATFSAELLNSSLVQKKDKKKRKPEEEEDDGQVKINT